MQNLNEDVYQHYLENKIQMLEKFINEQNLIVTTLQSHVKELKEKNKELEELKTNKTIKKNEKKTRKTRDKPVIINDEKKYLIRPNENNENDMKIWNEILNIFDQQISIVISVNYLIDILCNTLFNKNKPEAIEKVEHFINKNVIDFCKNIKCLNNEGSFVLHFVNHTDESQEWIIVKSENWLNQNNVK
jgi:hypothetical protein